MEVVAIAKNVRVSPQKVRLIVDQIKKMPPARAVTILPYVQKRAAKPLKKTIDSAIANAKHNFNLSPQTLIFKELSVGSGPMFKRYRAVARGRAHSIQRRTSHIRVILEGESANQKTESVKQGEEQSSKKIRNSKFEIRNSRQRRASVPKS